MLILPIQEHEEFPDVVKYLYVISLYGCALA